jgi:hypothetical protein
MKPQNRGKTDIEIFVDFFGKRFRHRILAEIFLWFVVFLNFKLPLPKNAMKTQF